MATRRHITRLSRQASDSTTPPAKCHADVVLDAAPGCYTWALLSLPADMRTSKGENWAPVRGVVVKTEIVSAVMGSSHDRDGRRDAR
jgi:hypothetical protein